MALRVLLLLMLLLLLDDHGAAAAVAMPLSLICYMHAFHLPLLFLSNS